MNHLMQLIDRWQQERSKWQADLDTDSNDTVARYAVAIFGDHIKQTRSAIIEQLQHDLNEIIKDITAENENGPGIVETAQTADTTDKP